MGDRDKTLYTETIHRFLTVYRYLRRCSRRLQKEGINGRKIAALRYLLEAGPHTARTTSSMAWLPPSVI